MSALPYRRSSVRTVSWSGMGFGVLVLIASLILPLLVAPWLIVDDAGETADAIVVLGGEAYPPNRTIHALNLYKQQRAPVVVFTGGALPGQPPEISSARVALRYALARGLPAEVALVVDTAQSTYDEATLVRDLAAHHGWRSLIIVTDPYHTRRAVRTFRAIIPDVQVTASVAPFLDTFADPLSRGVRVWRYATAELIKMSFYRLHYGIPLR
ncbi:YdcF family protein [Roseiflexus sp.]